MEWGTDRAIFGTPDRVTVANWMTYAHPATTEDIIKNGWQKTGLSYFENENSQEILFETRLFYY